MTQQAKDRFAVKEFTTWDSPNCSINTRRCEFEDGTESNTLVIHCDELNLREDVLSISATDSLSGKAFKVKTFSAYDEAGNKVALEIYFHSEREESGDDH